MKKGTRYIPLAILLLLALGACSTKNNTAKSRFWQAFTTRYNVYYNGKTNYDEQIKILENDYQDDYSQRLFIHPAEAYNNPKAPQPSGSFDRTIEKMEKAIALHSIKKKPKRKAGKGNDPKYKEWLKREEYNPFLHNAWYMLAKSEYMKGDFLNSAATFHYIARHFTWKPDLVQECTIWEALCYCALGWTTEADNILAHVHVDKIEDKRIRNLANLAFADYYVKDKQADKAIPYLSQAVKGYRGAQRVRLNFLLGQLYEETGQKDLAYQAYKRAGSSMGSSYRTKFNARIKQSAVFQGQDIKGEVRSLRNMARYDRNKEYLDQIYYAIGNLYLSRGDTAHAVENYKLAAEKSTRNGIDKAISQLALGGIYFNQHHYDLAQPCYSEAIPQLGEDYPDYKMLKKRSDVLDELAVYSQNVTLQDSLLRLSKLPLEEQKKVIKKIIDDLKKKEKEDADAAKREEALAQANAQGNTTGKTQSNAPTTYTINNDNSWYFYNTATKNAGKTAFQQQWGNRKLEDNWRRRNKNTFSLDDDSGDQASNTSPADTASAAAAGADTTKVDKEAQKRAEDPHFEEYYLKQIPSTPEQIQTSNDVIQEGLYNMGLILKDKMDDYASAASEWNELLTRYPDNQYRLDVYFNMYLMYMRQGNNADAERYRQLILSDFADSKYGKALTDSNYIDNLRKMDQVQEALYAQAYQDYLNNNNQAVHAAYDQMMRDYPLSKIMPKFMFIDALAYCTEKNYDKFKETIKDMLQRYPETDITPTASGILKGLNAGRKLGGSGGNLRGMLWTMRLGSDSTAAATDASRTFTPFQASKAKRQLFVLAFSNDSVSSNQLLYQVARHNFKTFKVQDFDLEQLAYGELGLIVVRGFNNYAEVTHYRSVFEADKELRLPAAVHQILISEDNFNLLVSEGRTFEEYFNFLEDENVKKVEAKVPDTATDDATLDQPAAVAQPQDQQGRSVRDRQPDATDQGDAMDRLRQAQADADAEYKNNFKDEKARREAAKQEQQRKKAQERLAREQAKQKARAEKQRQKDEARQKAQAEKLAKQRAEQEAKQRAEAEQQARLKAQEQARKQAEYERKRIEQMSQGVWVIDDSRDTTNQRPPKPKRQPVTADTVTAPQPGTLAAPQPQPEQPAIKEQPEAKEQPQPEQPAAEQPEAKEQPAVEQPEAQEQQGGKRRLLKKKSDEVMQAEREQKAAEKAEKDRQKAAEKAEKERKKAAEEAEKARQKQLKDAEKAREDSIKNAQKQHEQALKDQEKAREDSIKNAQKQREQELKAQQKAKEDARKAKEQARKDAQKAKEEARKQKAKEREERHKQREAERKAYQKKKQEAAKARKKAAEERRKARDRD